MTPLDASPAALQPWQDFYRLTGAAAATLTGLVLVAVTFDEGVGHRSRSRADRTPSEVDDGIGMRTRFSAFRSERRTRTVEVGRRAAQESRP